MNKDELQSLRVLISAVDAAFKKGAFDNRKDALHAATAANHMEEYLLKKEQ